MHGNSFSKIFYRSVPINHEDALDGVDESDGIAVTRQPTVSLPSQSFTSDGRSSTPSDVITDPASSVYENVESKNDVSCTLINFGKILLPVLKLLEYLFLKSF